jgi:D-sedoheptulose 7-phosphate isomerase
MKLFDAALEEHLSVMRGLQVLAPRVEELAERITRVLEEGGKILWCGNGGSAADSQHLAAELVGRFKRDRRAIPSLALTVDTSILTAVANDYGFEQVFARQIEALGRPGDLVIGLTTSGNSRNVVAALAQARLLGCGTVAFTGLGGGQVNSLADIHIEVPCTDTARIQEAHIFLGHILCDYVERHVSREEGESSLKTIHAD